MENDFDGALEDVEPEENENTSDNENENMDELDEQMGGLMTLLM